MSALARLLAALTARPALAGALALVYAAVSIAAHERVNQAVRALQQAAGPDLFRFAAVALGAGVVTALAVAIAGASAPRRRFLAAGFALWLVAAALAWRYLFTVVSEAIHYPQYALLTILLFPLTGRIGAAMLAANFVGFLDEANQYFVLHPDWGIYLDWNDIVMNALGTLLGGLLLALTGVEPAAKPRRAASLAFAATALLLAGGALLAAAGRIALRTPAGGRPPGAWLVLDRSDTSAQPFWVTAEWAQKRYHVLQSEPGAALLAAFAAFAFAVDRRERRGGRR
jgi:hypothetical protein